MSLLLSEATLLTFSKKSSKDCGFLALKIGMSFIKYCFSWKVDDLCFTEHQLFVSEDIGYYVLVPFDRITQLQTD